MLASQAQAIITFNYANDDSLITSAPSNGAPWDAVGSVSVDGSARGSGVYLGYGYILTANHVQGSSNQIDFGGGNVYTIDTGSYKRIGTTDLKVAQLTSTPTGLTGVQLFTSDAVNMPATLIGAGVGRANSNEKGQKTQQWGSSATVTKRWGTNTFEFLTLNKSNDLGTYDTLGTRTQDDEGNFEAALTRFDSGSGAFVKSGEQWYLAGLGSYVSTADETTFGPLNGQPGTTADTNYFVNIASYSTLINAEIPEPTTYALYFGIAAIGVCMLRKRRSMQ